MHEKKIIEPLCDVRKPDMLYLNFLFWGSLGSAAGKDNVAVLLGSAAAFAQVQTRQ